MFRFLIAICLFLPALAFTQDNPSSGNKGVISGTLIDAATGSAMEYVVVGVNDQATGKVVNGTITDELGNFQITGLAFQSYKLQISFVGYENKTIENIRLSPETPVHNTGKITLKSESQLLNEITITGEAALIEARADKIVYNAERDVTSAGGDASDVLRKVPLLSVDFEGNVSMRGSENVKILINGRPSGMFSSNVADALKMMPADQIKSVEVITAPSAKYDGEGTAGIINIITRKKNIEGIAGSVDLNAGTRHHRGNGNINYGKGKLGINVSGGGHYSIPQTGSTSYLREGFGLNPSLLTQDGTNESSRLGFRTNAGFEYNPDSESTLSGSVSFRGWNNNNKNQVDAEYRENNQTIDSYLRTSDGESARKGLDFEIDYKRELAFEGQEWSIAFEYDRDFNNSDFDYFQDYTFPAQTLDIRESNINKGENLELTFQSDYTHPFTQKFKMETGVKGTLRQIESDFRFLSLDPDQNAWIVNPERTDIFYYDQNVYAAYASGNLQIDSRTTIIGGLRVELTDLKGQFEEFNAPFDNQYISYLPNISISRKTGEFNQLRVSYNQRIQRPNQRHINPFVEYNDNRDISYGNPNLFPELVHQAEVTGTFFIKGNMITTTLFGRRTQDLIENLVTIDDQGVSTSTFYNFGKRSAVGVNVFGSLNLGKLSLRGGFDVNAWKVDGEFESAVLSNRGYDYNGRMNLTWTLSETLRIEGFGFYRSPTYTVQGKTPNWTMMSFGIRKELFKKRLSVGLNITEPFRENLRLERELEGTDFYTLSNTLRPVRSFGVNVGYRFGKIDFKERTGKKKINNNDLKEEDHGGEGQF